MSIMNHGLSSEADLKGPQVGHRRLQVSGPLERQKNVDYEPWALGRRNLEFKDRRIGTTTGTSASISASTSSSTSTSTSTSTSACTSTSTSTSTSTLAS